MYKIERMDDADEAREIHRLAFPKDAWVGDDHTHWVMRGPKGQIAGFCSAVYWPDLECIFLSRAAVVATARGKGLQRRMIRARLAWAGDETAAKVAITYTSIKNFDSIVNLLRAGFRFYDGERWRRYWHFFYWPLSLPDPTWLEATLKKASKRV